jgi:molecular chaperone DnaJ
MAGRDIVHSLKRGIESSVLSLGLLAMMIGYFAIPDFRGSWLSMERKQEPAGPDIVMEMEIELDEAFRGTYRTIELNRDEYCALCRGEGWPAPACKTCRGRREVISIRRILPAVVPCPACAGERAQATDPCSSCLGRGRTSRLVRLEIQVPPGVETGMVLRLRNQGALGNLGAPRGNLCIRITVKEHPL